MNDGEQIVATPRLGLAKGIIAILLGMVLLVIVFSLVLFAELIVLAVLSNPFTHPDPWSIAEVREMMAAPMVSGLVPFGLCLWRGIVAIRRRKVRRVTRLNFGLWLGFFVAACIPIVLLLS